MKIAFAYDVPYPWHKGGIEKILSIESAELAKRNEVHFFTLKWPGMRNEFTREKVHYHAYSSSSIEKAYKNGRRSIGNAIVFALSLFHLFSYDFDVLVIDQFPYLHIPVAWLFCRIKGCKLVMKVAEVWDRDYWIKYTNPIIGNLAYWFSKAWAKSADFYIVNSDDTKEKFKLFANKESNKILVFSPVLDEKIITAAAKKKRKIADVIFAGRLIKEKRLDKWVDAVSKAHKIDNKITGAIIGDGIEMKSIKSYIKKANATKFISMLGRMESTAELYEAIAGSNVMLNMSEREGLSIISLESIALGTPVLLPKYTPIPKEVTEMCIVQEEKRIPETILEICSSKDKRKYIRSTKGLATHYTSGVNSNYGKIFKNLGIKP